MNSKPQPIDIYISKELPTHATAIENLAGEIFGPGRFARAAFRLREGVDSEADLSFVAMLHNELVGSVKLTRIMISDEPSLLLGPLMVSNKMRNIGLGRELMNRAIFAVKEAGHSSVLLVGDLAYYKKFGFDQVKYGTISLPGPADPDRILICNLDQKSNDQFQGKVTRHFNK